MKTHSFQQGAVLLPLAIIIFVISLSLAGFVTWQLWQKGWELPLIQKRIIANTTPSETDDLLSANFSLDSELLNQQQELTQKLLVPMRQYYATRAERLGAVSVKVADTPKHNIQVSIVLTKDLESKTIIFYFDKDKDNNYPSWEPGLLENTN